MEWVYKSTDTKLDRHGTLILAERGFLCRSAHTKTGEWVANVQMVQLGDILHFYHRTGDKTRTVGSYKIVDREGHRQAASLGERVDGTALFAVDEPGFVAQVDKEGVCQPDPVVGKLTGWLLQSVGKPPPFNASMFGRMQSLVQYRP
jgi:hypothetical protein